MKRSITIYSLLALVWGLMIVWQGIEHFRFKASMHTMLIDHARDISNSLGVVIRSQAHFGVIRQTILENALQELVKSSELRAVALLNSESQIVASAGSLADLNIKNLPSQGERWEGNSVTFVNLVDLGFDSKRKDERGYAPTIIWPATNERDREPLGPPFGPPGGPPPPYMGSRPDAVPNGATNPNASETIFDRNRPRPDESPPWESRPDAPPRNATEIAGANPQMDRESPNRPPEEPPPFMDSRPEFAPGGTTNPSVANPQFRSDRPRRPRFFGRPFWMDEKLYTELLKKGGQGVHGFVLHLSTESYHSEITRDFWLRTIIGNISGVAVFAIGIAWRNLIRSSELQLRLIRAGEKNSRLREMNIAAAGLAHETRNPLNIVRGLAQMISTQEDISTEIRERSRQITDEVDRVTARLNEFIDYSKPREPKPAPINLHAVVQDVKRTLDSDLEDKTISFSISGPELVVEADETLLRQVLFNLLLNSIQAVGYKGNIDLGIKRTKADEAAIEIQDDGPGVPENIREEIFRPYFTTHKQGTGLGLAIVRQIILAHGWDIQCLPGVGQGARFRISGIKIAVK